MAKKKRPRVRQEKRARDPAAQFLEDNTQREIPSENPAKSMLMYKPGMRGFPQVTVQRSLIGGPNHKPTQTPNALLLRPGTNPAPVNIGQVAEAYMRDNSLQSQFTAVRFPGQNNNPDDYIPVTVRRDELARDYNRTLLESGYGYTRWQLEHDFDMLDMRGAYKDKGDGHSVPTESAYDQADTDYENLVGPFAAAIPCFNEGVVRANDNRYIYFRVTGVNTERQLVTVWLHDHMEWDGWTPGMCGEVGFIFSGGNRFALDTNDEDKMLPSQIYKKLDTAKFSGWTDTDREIWQNEAVDVAERAERHMEQNGCTPLSTLGMQFFWLISLANALIHANRKKAKPAAKKPETVPRTDEEKSANTPVQYPERTVRAVGPITVKSENLPQTMTKRRAALYRTPKWTQAGHWRYYKKTGKRVWIEPQVKTRQALKDITASPAHRTVQIKEGGTTQ